MKFLFSIGKIFVLKVNLSPADLSTLVNIIQLVIWLYAVVRLVMLLT